jgi:hypothetical protein
LLLLAALVA